MAESFYEAVGDSAAQVGAKLGAVAADSAAAVGGGRFAFEPDQIRAVITEWDSLIESYEADRRAANRLTQVQAPGNEYASRSMAEAANASGQKVVDSIVAQRDYCISQRDKFQAALNQYMGVEETTAGDMNRQLPFGGADQQSSGAF